MNPGIDLHAVLRGAALALAGTVPVLLAVEVVDAVVGIGRESNLVFVFYLLVVAALVAGARLAAQAGFDAPLTNGALAALVAYAVVMVVVIAVRLGTGRDVDPVALTFNAMVAVSAGILGAVLALGRRPRTDTAHRAELPVQGEPEEQPGR